MGWEGDPFAFGSLPLLGASRLRVDPGVIDALIEQDGTPGEYRPGSLCPCRQPESGIARGDCPICRGIGWYYPVEKRCACVRALAGSRTLERKILAAAQPIDGSIKVTFPSRMQPARMDLWLPRGETHVIHEQHVRRGAEYRPALQTAIERDLGFAQPPSPTASSPRDIRSEQLRYPEITDIDEVSWITDQDRAPSMRKLVIGVRGMDWRLKDGAIEFVDGGRGPLAGESYAVKYHAPACYVVDMEEPRFREVTGLRQPYQVTLKRLDVFGSPDVADGGR